MARVLDPGTAAKQQYRCRCGACGALIEFEQSELKPISEQPPYFGLPATPCCGARVFKDGSPW